MLRGSDEISGLVTGATGKTGAAVVRELLAAGWPVRAVVRGIDERSERLKRGGAEVVVADLYDPEQLLSAMKEVSRAYYCPPSQPFMIQSSVAFAAAAHQAELESVVLMSQWLSSPSHPALMTRQTWLTDQLFQMLPDMNLTIVNPGWFADNNLRVMSFAAHLGIFPVLTGDSRNAPPSNEDIARVVAAVLMDPDKHAGKTYRPTGPKLLSVYDMIDIMSRVLGRKVRPVPMPLWMLNKSARMQGESAFTMSSLRYYIEDHKQGAFEFNAPTDHVLQVTGKPAEDFETTVRRYANLPANRPTFGNFVRTLFEFSITPFAPGYNIKKYQRMMDFPSVATPRFAMRDEQWKREHQPTRTPKTASSWSSGISESAHTN